MISLNLLPAPHYQLIGHRGASKQAPENTLASFKRAAELGLNWIEFDVRLTKDNELVIFHDDKLERTTNGTGLAVDHTLHELKQLDAGSWFSAEFKQEKIPTLIETFSYLKQWHLTPIIEIKCIKNQAEALTKKIAYAVADCLKAHWEAPIPPISSFDHRALLYYRERLGQDVPVGLLVDDIYPEHIALAHNTPNSAIHCSQRYVTPQRVQALQKENIPLFIFTVNDKALKDAYLEAGAAAVFTDYPERLI